MVGTEAFNKVKWPSRVLILPLTYARYGCGLLARPVGAIHVVDDLGRALCGRFGPDTAYIYPVEKMLTHKACKHCLNAVRNGIAFELR